LGSDNISEPARGNKYPLCNQRQLSADRTNTINSICQVIRPAYQPQLSVQLRTTYKPPPVTFTINNRIVTALFINTLESLFAIFSRNFQVLFKPKKNVKLRLSVSYKCFNITTSTGFPQIVYNKDRNRRSFKSQI
jgi:hypothetical protein